MGLISGKYQYAWESWDTINIFTLTSTVLCFGEGSLTLSWFSGFFTWIIYYRVGVRKQSG